jgi:hypothetical protein
MSVRSTITPGIPGADTAGQRASAMTGTPFESQRSFDRKGGEPIAAITNVQVTRRNFSAVANLG